MDKILKKHIVALIAGIIISSALVIVALFFYKSFNKKILKVGEVKERIASYKNNKKAFTEEVDRLKTLDNRLKFLENNIITEANTPNLLSNLETIAQNSGIVFEITSVQTLVKDSVNKLFIEINTKGSFEETQSFLEQLQHQPFQVKINTIYLSEEQGGEVGLPSSDIKPINLDKSKVVVPTTIRPKQWRSVATIEILSF
jgi:Tfp pilus assembly protein PilO